MEENKENLESIFQNLFQSGETNEEGLLRVASDYSKQYTAEQIKGLILLKFATYYVSKEKSEMLNEIIDNWQKLKQWNNSALFISRIIDSISLRKFITEKSFNIDIKK